MAEITVKDITTGSISGTGVFDELMASAQTRLDSQYKQNRIKGADYSKVYLGGMEAILMNSIQFILGRQEASAKADLLVQQVLTEKEQLKLVTAQVNKMAKEEQLIDGQIEKMKSEIKVMEQQVLESIQKVETMRASVWAERAKTNSDVTIFNDPYNPDTLGLTKVSGLVGNQIDKTNAEVTLLAQKGLTEEAQTKDIVGKSPDSYTVVGILGKQKNLYQKQTEGFDRDAEQKLSKIMVDSWNTRRISNDEENPLGTGLENPDICSVLAIAKAGIKANSEGCAGGNNGDNVNDVEGVNMDILARTNVLEDCEAWFESHVMFDSLPTVHVHEWCWDVGLQGREASSQCKTEDQTAPDGHFFFTKFFEPGPNTVTLTITLWDTNTESEYHNKKITFKKTFEAIATDTPHNGPTDCSGLLSLTSLAEKAVRDAHPEDYAMTANPKTDPMTWGDVRPVSAQHGVGDTSKHGELYTYENYPARKPSP